MNKEIVNNLIMRIYRLIIPYFRGFGIGILQPITSLKCFIKKILLPDFVILHDNKIYIDSEDAL